MNAHALQIAQRPTLIGRAADRDADVVAPALDALRLVRVERLPHLPPQILQGEPERLRSARDAQLRVRLPAGNESVMSHTPA